jgi:hypothetical protein
MHTQPRPRNLTARLGERILTTCMLALAPTPPLRSPAGAAGATSTEAASDSSAAAAAAAPPAKPGANAPPLELALRMYLNSRLVQHAVSAARRRW